MTTTNNQDNNECYFKLDSTVDGDLLASNIQTFDTQAKGISSTETFSVEGNATFKDQVSATGLTSASTYKLNATGPAPSSITIDMKNNRLSNPALPKNPCDPVPANYVRSPQYFFCSKPIEGTFTFDGSSRYLPITGDGSNYTLYQSNKAGDVFRFVSWDQNSKKLNLGGNTAIQLLAAGTYILTFTIGKRWGWNNGWGGSIRLFEGKFTGDGTILCGSTVYSGGGYSTIGYLSTAVYRDHSDVDPDPNNPSNRYMNNFLFVRNGDSSAVIGNYSFTLLYFAGDKV
ncbi:conserved hypothetical protein [Chlamydia pneumoniae LPCoLN]|uniref:hypothetical protein n=1 Tax=Chlamydia pneumoniae TaxID=83558 RepID=UPI0001BD9CBC|nr:hypothetical protein [Chlamydia pneumoniae]ACZ33235.1 conserved hypothetical protein [Chlamydia pneumoniae LPCoLN]ETR80140.1 hypothetical protein X556_0544 [Chlamydia pneumoniae B21]